MIRNVFIRFCCLPLLALLGGATAGAEPVMVHVGDPGNEPSMIQWGRHGSVGYEYLIGKYEVTIAEYAGFLNATAKIDPYGPYYSEMEYRGIVRSGYGGNYSYVVTPGWENRPVCYVRQVPVTNQDK